MTTARHDPVARIDALLDDHAPLLPVPVRGPLRRAAGLTQKQVATRIGVQPLAVKRWEAGSTEPRPGERRTAYSRLLQGLARRHPEVLAEPGS
ncbi:helix-turn-helix domain-containing protein [Streptomyces sp. SPB4]|uniref:helix-turn-helix domain-containing protein n=1 Tax=Streptomyces sp. SPB4 TaxID=2940553 RepID=UPI002476B77B|nr:helix-turn-helix domain-containing protein [Streptomyces sp. SPB4]MDH6545883.1 DNA-binding transcriptional regulator YiaG [Streptomyces sp. SPB4]